MDKIDLSVPTETPTSASEFESAILSVNSTKKKVAKTFMNYAGILVGVFLIFAVIVVMTVDVRLITATELAELGLDFFVILFCSYTMYISCSDSGMRAAFDTEEYKKNLAKYEAVKRRIIEDKCQDKLPEFCTYYIDTELRNTRNGIISIVGLSYSVYEEKYLGKDDRLVMEDTTLSKTQKKAVIKANKVSPLTLTPEMLMKRGRGTGRRAPLGITPQKRKGIDFISKFFTNGIVSILLAVIVFEVVADPSWAVFASVVLKLVSVVANGFAGYKTGYENIVIHTSNYLQDQTDLIEQALQFFSAPKGEKYGEQLPNQP